MCVINYQNLTTNSQKMKLKPFWKRSYNVERELFLPRIVSTLEKRSVRIWFYCLITASVTI